MLVSFFFRFFVCSFLRKTWIYFALSLLFLLFFFILFYFFLFLTIDRDTWSFLLFLRFIEFFIGTSCENTEQRHRDRSFRRCSFLFIFFSEQNLICWSSVRSSVYAFNVILTMRLSVYSIIVIATKQPVVASHECFLR